MFDVIAPRTCVYCCVEEPNYANRLKVSIKNVFIVINNLIYLQLFLFTCV